MTILNMVGVEDPDSCIMRSGHEALREPSARRPPGNSSLNNFSCQRKEWGLRALATWHVNHGSLLSSTQHHKISGCWVPSRTYHDSVEIMTATTTFNHCMSIYRDTISLLLCLWWHGEGVHQVFATFISTVLITSQPAHNNNYSITIITIAFDQYSN